MLGQKYHSLPHELLAIYDPAAEPLTGLVAYTFDITATAMVQEKQKPSDALKHTNTTAYVASLSSMAREKAAWREQQRLAAEKGV